MIKNRRFEPINKTAFQFELKLKPKGNNMTFNEQVQFINSLNYIIKKSTGNKPVQIISETMNLLDDDMFALLLTWLKELPIDYEIKSKYYPLSTTKLELFERILK